jgi:hypothetical protein
MSEHSQVVASRNWGAYLDALEAALASLQAGSFAELPKPGDLGPLPAEARERAKALLGGLRSVEASLSWRRDELSRRLEGIKTRPHWRQGLVV